jgi:hypothetical protein
MPTAQHRQQSGDAMQLPSAKIMQASAADEDKESMAIHTNLTKASLLVECISDTLDNPQREPQAPPQRRTVENSNHSSSDGDNIGDGDHKLDVAATTDTPCEDDATKPKDPAAPIPPASDDVAVTFPQRVRTLNLWSHNWN